MILCAHNQAKKCGKDRYGHQRFRCSLCGKMWSEAPARPASLLGDMLLPEAEAKMVLKLLVEGSSIRSAVRITGVSKRTILKLLVHFGTKCQSFMDVRMRGLNLTHLQFDEQHTTVAKKQARLTTEEKASRHDIGEVYIWTCIDQKTKLLPGFLIGKRSADNARRFMVDISNRVVRPNSHASDAHAYLDGGYKPALQISTDGFNAYP